MEYPIGKTGCRAAIINKDKEILLLQRSLNTKFAPGEWNLPGGKIDLSDESAVSAIMREVKEETNLDFIVTDKFKFYSALLGERDFSLIVYLGTYSGNLVLNDESIDAQFYSYKKILNMKIAFLHPEVLEDLYKAGFIA